MTTTSVHSTRHQRRRRLLPVLLLPGCALALSACTAKESRSVNITPQIVPAELYVAPAGLDSNPGTREAPLRSLARAAQLVTPGAVVNVLPGTYQGGLRTAIDGLPNARIVYRSTRRWGARIVPPAASRSGIAWDNRASYVDIEGFEVDGSLRAGDDGQRWAVGIRAGGAADRIAGNHVHDIGTTLDCAGKSGAGIVVDSDTTGADADVDANSVHDIGAPGCRTMQGIRADRPAGIRDNIVYRVTGAGIRLWRGAHDAVVANNTVAASGAGIVVGGGAFHGAGRTDDHTQVYNNIVFDNRYGIAERGATGRHNSYRNNLVFGNREADWRLAPGMAPSGTVAAPPDFLAYSRDGTPDFRLAARSPAIGKGLDQGVDGPDFFGKIRARAAAVDIGACQH